MKFGGNTSGYMKNNNKSFKVVKMTEICKVVIKYYLFLLGHKKNPRNKSISMTTEDLIIQKREKRKTRFEVNVQIQQNINSSSLSRDRKVHQNEKIRANIQINPAFQRIQKNSKY